MHTHSLTQSKLKEILHYDPETGNWTWILDRGTKVKAGDKAGTLHPHGYLKIMIDYKRYYAHRLAWLYMNGDMPSECIDHKNGDTTDNRWCNLREANHNQNMRNSKSRKNNTSGHKGVYWDKRRSNWYARIWVDSHPVSLGTFDSKEDASKAYITASKKYHKEFARL